MLFGKQVTLDGAAAFHRDQGARVSQRGGVLPGTARAMSTSKNLTFQKSRIDKSMGYEALEVKIRGFSRCPDVFRGAL